jgi:transcriptional regulatory protein LevR
MKRPAFSVMRIATFTLAIAAALSAAPLAHAQTDVENTCRSSGGDYSSEEVQPHWGANPVLIETCCTGTGTARKCVTYRDGVQGPTYGGG